MRCFTYSDGKIERGFRFHDMSGIKVGIKPVVFDDSLVFTSGCHFGQYIVNAVVQPAQSDEDATALHAPPSASADSAEPGASSSALLLVRIPVRRDSEIYTRPSADTARVVHGGERVRRLFYRDRDRNACTVWEALIQFTGPGEFILKEQIQRTLSRMERVMGIEPGFPLKRTVRVSFDGVQFLSLVDQPRGTEPTVERTRIGLYGEGDTLRLIAEVIGHQDRL